MQAYLLDVADRIEMLAAIDDGAFDGNATTAATTKKRKLHRIGNNSPPPSGSTDSSETLVVDEDPEPPHKRARVRRQIADESDNDNTIVVPTEDAEMPPASGPEDGDAEADAAAAATAGAGAVDVEQPEAVPAIADEDADRLADVYQQEEPEPQPLNEDEDEDQQQVEEEEEEAKDQARERHQDSDAEAERLNQNDDDASDEIKRIFGQLMGDGVRAHQAHHAGGAGGGGDGGDGGGDDGDEKKAKKKKKIKPPGFPLYYTNWNDTKAPQEEPTTDPTWCFLCECSKGTFEMNKNEWYQDMLKYIDDNSHKVRASLLALKVQTVYYNDRLRNTIEDPAMRMPWYRKIIIAHIEEHAPTIRFLLEKANKDFLHMKQALVAAATYNHPETGTPQPDLKVMAEYRHQNKAHIDVMVRLAPMRQENVL